MMERASIQAVLFCFLYPMFQIFLYAFLFNLVSFSNLYFIRLKLMCLEGVYFCKFNAYILRPLNQILEFRNLHPNACFPIKDSHVMFSSMLSQLRTLSKPSMDANFFPLNILSILL